MLDLLRRRVPAHGEPERAQREVVRHLHGAENEGDLAVRSIGGVTRRRGRCCHVRCRELREHRARSCAPDAHAQRVRQPPVVAFGECRAVDAEAIGAEPGDQGRVQLVAAGPHVRRNGRQLAADHTSGRAQRHNHRHCLRARTPARLLPSTKQQRGKCNALANIKGRDALWGPELMPDDGREVCIYLLGFHRHLAHALRRIGVHQQLLGAGAA
mmetsp:Transcript_98220/g.249244  ORF Transcript_98220/g.249244 Transcript_98220/m.249244 type:complete len:213 (+) Transcript_98220:193-831(+)